MNTPNTPSIYDAMEAEGAAREYACGYPNEQMRIWAAQIGLSLDKNGCGEYTSPLMRAFEKGWMDARHARIMAAVGGDIPAAMDYAVAEMLRHRHF